MSTKKLNLFRAALEDHKQVGKELVPPFVQIGPLPEQVFWERDLLPEFLWIDALVHTHGQSAANRMLNAFLTEADRFNQHPTEILDGTIGAFRLISDDQRPNFIEQLAGQIETTVVSPLRHIVALYPECPMGWMVPKQLPDRDLSITSVRDSVVRLFAGKEPHAGFCRTLPLTRFLVHQKVFISSDLKDTIEAIKQYPHGDRYRAEVFARAIHNGELLRRAKEYPDTFAWSRYFWRLSRRVVPCLV